MIKIMTERSYQHWPSWDVVYEWEDIMVDVLSAELVDLHVGFLGQVGRLIRKIYRKTGIKGKFSYTENKPIRFVWVMDAKIYKEYTYSNCIPIFLDFSTDMIDEIVVATRDLSFFWVTSMAIYQMLKVKARNVQFIPLSISDK